MSGKILLIDSNENYIAELTDKFEKKGYDCSSAATAKEALKMLSVNSFRAVILEAMLEDVSSGFRVAKYLHDNQDGEKTVVLMVSELKKLTGLDFTERVETGEVPVDLFLHKPVDSDIIVSSLERILGSS